MSDVIVVRELNRTFGKLRAVNNISFSVPTGSIFGFLGPNGSGKSTVIRMLCGILAPTSGFASVMGWDITKDSELIRANIGYMSQKFSLYSELSVYENLSFYGKLYGLNSAMLKQRRDYVMELVGIHERQQQIAGNLSGGWKQRLALACALIHNPRVVFLDEPTAGIDPVARRKLWDLIFQLSGQGITFFVTTHYMDEAERCTQIGYIYLGDLIVCGIPDDLKKHPQVTPEDYQRWEVVSAEPTKLLREVARLPYAQDATIFGQAIHLMVHTSINADNLAENLQSLIKAPVTVRTIAPSLEDVFVRLTNVYEERNRNQRQEYPE